MVPLVLRKSSVVIGISAAAALIFATGTDFAAPSIPAAFNPTMVQAMKAIAGHTSLALNAPTLLPSRSSGYLTATTAALPDAYQVTVWDTRQPLHVNNAAIVSERMPGGNVAQFGAVRLAHPMPPQGAPNYLSALARHNPLWAGGPATLERGKVNLGDGIYAVHYQTATQVQLDWMEGAWTIEVAGRSLAMAEKAAIPVVHLLHADYLPPYPGIYAVRLQDGGRTAITSIDWMRGRVLSYVTNTHASATNPAVTGGMAVSWRSYGKSSLTTATVKVGSAVYAVRIPLSARGIDVPATTYHGEIYWVEPPVMSEGPGPNLNPGIPGGQFTVYRASVPVQGAVLNPDAATLVGSVPLTVPALLARGGYYNFPDNILVTAGAVIVGAAARGTGMNQPVSDPVYLIEPGHAARLLVQLHDTGGDFSEIAAADGVVAWESGTDAIVPTSSFSFEGFVYHLGTGVTQSVSLPNPNGIPPLQITHGIVAFGTKAVSLTQPVSPAWPTAPAVALPKGASLPAYWPVQTPSERSQATTSVTGLTVSISGVGPNHTEVPNLQLKEGSSAPTPTSVAVQGQTEEIHGVAVTIDSRAAAWQEGNFHYVVQFTHRGSAWSLSAVVAHVMQELPPTGNPVGAWASGTCQITVSARYGIGGPNSSCLIHFQNHAGLPVTIWSRSISEAFDTAESLLS